MADAHIALARMQAAGMYGLLSEVLGSGALFQRYGSDDDLTDRIKAALADYERLHAVRLQSIAQSITSIEEDGDTTTIRTTLASHGGTA